MVPFFAPAGRPPPAAALPGVPARACGADPPRRRFDPAAADAMNRGYEPGAAPAGRGARRLGPGRGGTPMAGGRLPTPKTESLTATPTIGGVTFPFRLYTRPLTLGDHGTV